MNGMYRIMNSRCFVVLIAFCYTALLAGASTNVQVFQKSFANSTRLEVMRTILPAEHSAEMLRTQVVFYAEQAPGVKVRMNDATTTYRFILKTNVLDPGSELWKQSLGSFNDDPHELIIILDVLLNTTNLVVAYREAGQRICCNVINLASQEGLPWDSTRLMGIRPGVGGANDRGELIAAENTFKFKLVSSSATNTWTYIAEKRGWSNDTVKKSRHQVGNE